MLIYFVNISDQPKNIFSLTDTDQKNIGRSLVNITASITAR